MRKFVSKAWGYEDWIHNSPEYCGKLLFVKKGLQCSLHYHKLKTETFYLESGEVVLRYVPAELKDNFLRAYTDLKDDPKAPAGLLQYIIETEVKTKILRPGDSFHLPVGTIHQFFGVLDSHIFEFSTQHFDEDSYRIQLD